MNHKERIEKTKQGFEESFQVGSYYDKQTKDEWEEIGKSVGLKYVDDFETKIRFPRQRAESLELEKIIIRHKEGVIKGYEVEMIEDEVWITEKVNNIIFRKEL